MKKEWCFVMDRFIPESEVYKALPHKYDMELNRDDMMVVLKALHNDPTEDAEMLLRDFLTTIKVKL